jgi:hypothetical protein
VTFAGNEIHDAVAVDVSKRCAGVHLREGDAAGILGGEITHDQMLDERNFAGGIALLLVPGQSPTVCAQARNYVVEAVAIEIVD